MVLRDEEKWRSQQGFSKDNDSLSDRGSKRNKNTEDGHYTSSSSNANTSIPEEVSTPSSRPLGKKASKDKGKKSHFSSTSTENEQVTMLERLNIEKEKIQVMREFHTSFVETEKRKNKRENRKMIMKLMEMDPTTMSEPQRKLYEHQLEELLKEE